MQGMMMDFPLTLQYILRRAESIFPRREVVTKTAHGTHRTTYADMARRARKLGSALDRLGLKRGDRVGSFAWNTYRHLELYFGVPCSGRVLHTLNIRLFGEQVAYIVNHAEDRVIFVDDNLMPVLEKLQDEFKSVELYVVMGDGPIPETTLAPVMGYEELLATGDDEYVFPALDERDAAMMCYTSGTTGNPKGVVYAHRSMVLHSMGSAMTDCMGLSQRDTTLPVVPMFHANSWGYPYTATLVGAKQVFPGAFMQPQAILELLQSEQVTVAAGVPTIWIGILQALSQGTYDLSSLRLIISGGSAVPQSLIEKYQRLGLNLTQAWGMTETSPLGSVAHLRPEIEALPESEQYRVRAKAGLPVPGVEVRVVNEAGEEVAWDGQTIGELQVRGPWVISGYYNDERSQGSFQDGWFRTGDVATLDEYGYIQIVDRTKDLVKSGGEWISTVDLEGALMAHPKVLEASVIAVPHPKWQERPLACVVTREGVECTREEIYEFLRPRFARWSLPDDIVFVAAIPKTSVGKFDKKVLRDQFRTYQLPEIEPAR
jgi:fatty-acyl-CoA synthase